MANARRLTKTIVEGASLGDRDTYLWDPSLRGFGVKLTPKGARVYLVQYRSATTRKTRRVTLGRHGDPWTAEKARGAAVQLLARVRLGQDPFEDEVRRREGERAAITAKARADAEAEADAFPRRVDEFIERYARPKNRRWLEARRILTSRDLADWKDRTVGSITGKDVVTLIDRAADRSQGAARLLFAHLRRFFNWCVERLYISTSPCLGLKGPALYKPRDRVLSDVEVGLAWAASQRLPHPFGPLIRLLLLTGQRREEVSAMRWAELDLPKRQWVIPAERAKNGQAHAVDLSEPAFEILRELERNKRSGDNDGNSGVETRTRSTFVFTTTGTTPVSGHAKIKLRLDELIETMAAESDPDLNLTPWRIHDLRRTAATGMVRLGFGPHVVEAVLNHRSGVRGGLVAVYQHYDHRPERKAALAAWGRHVVSLQAVDQGNLFQPQSSLRQVN